MTRTANVVASLIVAATAVALISSGPASAGVPFSYALSIPRLLIHSPWCSTFGVARWGGGRNKLGEEP
jgi:hypothetical protein